MEEKVEEEKSRMLCIFASVHLVAILGACTWYVLWEM